MNLTETITARAALPEFSRRVYDAINARLYEAGFSDIEGNDIAEDLKVIPEAVGGAVAHLVEVGLVEVEDADVNRTRYHFLHTPANDDGIRGQLENAIKMQNARLAYVVAGTRGGNDSGPMAEEYPDDDAGRCEVCGQKFGPYDEQGEFVDGGKHVIAHSECGLHNGLEIA